MDMAIRKSYLFILFILFFFQFFLIFYFILSLYKICDGCVCSEFFSGVKKLRQESCLNSAVTLGFTLRVRLLICDNLQGSWLG